jgi:hypothetical protein
MIKTPWFDAVVVHCAACVNDDFHDHANQAKTIVAAQQS